MEHLKTLFVAAPADSMIDIVDPPAANVELYYSLFHAVVHDTVKHTRAQMRTHHDWDSPHSFAVLAWL